MITAREDVALIERSRLSLSTRYHPLVFSAAAGTPAVAMANSYYSSVRMRGAMENVGLQSFVIPATDMDLVSSAVAEALSPGDRLKARLDRSSQEVVDLQRRWWDALVASLRSGAPVEFDPGEDQESFKPAGAWSNTNETRLPVFNQYSHMIDERDSLARERNALVIERERLDTQLTRTTADLERYRNRKAIRVLDALGRRGRRS